MKKATAKKSVAKDTGTDSPARLIDARIKKLGDWRGETLARVRAIIRQADPDVVEEVKWRKPSNGMLGVPVWEHDGIICTGETYKAAVKLTFARGAALKDPSAPLQRQPRRRHSPRHRHSRGRCHQREGAEGAVSRSGRTERRDARSEEAQRRVSRPLSCR